jgi:dehydratase
MRARKSYRFAAVATVIGLGVMLTGCADPPTKVTTPINYSCQINPNQFPLPTTTGTFAGTYDTTAPQAVAPAGTAAVAIAMQTFRVDGSTTANGTVTQISNVVSKFTIPANATLASQSIIGGTNIGPGTPTSTVSGNTVTLSVPGPMASNTDITLPIVSMSLAVTGAAGTRIDPHIAGSSFGSPGLTFATRITGTPIGTLNPTFACFPSPSPSLHSILISNDVSAPVITVGSPVAKQTIVQAATVNAGYSCDDGTGTGVQSCVGTVANGAAINTSTLGDHTFTVTATDNQGLVSTANVVYTVVAPT